MKIIIYLSGWIHQRNAAVVRQLIIELSGVRRESLPDNAVAILYHVLMNRAIGGKEKEAHSFRMSFSFKNGFELNGLRGK